MKKAKTRLKHVTLDGAKVSFEKARDDVGHKPMLIQSGMFFEMPRKLIIRKELE